MPQVLNPAQVIQIREKHGGRFTAVYWEWNGQPAECPGHDHLTRIDALACAEERLRYRS
jgi:hypothetical protein